MRLTVDGQTVADWPNGVTSAAQNYEFVGYTSGTVRVEHYNDGNNGCDRNLFVDYLEVDGNRLQTESVADRTGCGNGQWLWCNGTI